jgi:hypothetical protein
MPFRAELRCYVGMYICMYICAWWRFQNLDPILHTTYVGIWILDILMWKHKYVFV